MVDFGHISKFIIYTIIQTIYLILVMDSKISENYLLIHTSLAKVLCKI